MFRTLRLSVVLAAFAAGSALYAQLEGYVTRAGTPQDFDVNGIHVLCTVAGEGARKKTPTPEQRCAQHAYGEYLQVYGRHDKKTQSFTATAVQAPKQIVGKKVAGVAVIDAVLAPDMVRADGRAIRITPTTHVERDAPLVAASPLAAGQWIEYEGKFGDRGVVEANTAAVYLPNMTPAERKLRDRSEFDPAAVSEGDRQSGMSKVFRGVDYKRIPAVQDEALQLRVKSIGQRLVPDAQKQLAVGDPERLNFRFEAVESSWKDAITMPNGIILVPASMARNLNDDELAAVLADNIATAIEKQAYRRQPAEHTMTAANIAGAVGSVLVPGLGLATGVGTGVAGHNIEKHNEEQSGRSALVLMHAAGFDVRQAPLAWWRLSTNHEEFMQKNIPYRAAYLFDVLAESWTPGSPLADDAGLPH